MDTPLVIFALIAVVAMGMMVFADSAITGEGISIDRFDPAMAKKGQKAMEKQQYTPPANTKTICDCPNLYGNSILTTKESFFAGMSVWDCQLIREIIKLRKELKKSTTHLDSWDDACTSFGW